LDSRCKTARLDGGSGPPERARLPRDEAGAQLAQWVHRLAPVDNPLCGSCGEDRRRAGWLQISGRCNGGCKSVAKASKVRILHLPRSAPRGPDQRKRRPGPLARTPVGYLAQPMPKVRRRVADLRKREAHRRPCGMRAEVASPSGAPCGLVHRLTCSNAGEGVCNRSGNPDRPHSDGVAFRVREAHGMAADSARPWRSGAASSSIGAEGSHHCGRGAAPLTYLIGYDGCG